MTRMHTGIVVLALLVAGCSTVSVDRAKSLSSAGVAYTKATSSLIDVAIDATLDGSSELQVRTKPNTPVPKAAEAGRVEFLTTLDTELIGNVVAYTRLKRSVAALEDYFQALSQLTDGSPADAADTAVRTLADRLNGVNEALDRKGDGKPLISDERKGALAGLAKVITKEVHGAAVSKALERDAPIIGRALVVQAMVVQAASDDIRTKLAAANASFYTDRVVGPYKSGNIGSAWIDDRRTYLKVKAVEVPPAEVATAEAAAKQVQSVWQRVLSGEYSPKELTATLKDVEELLSAVNALKTANKAK